MTRPYSNKFFKGINGRTTEFLKNHQVIAKFFHKNCQNIVLNNRLINSYSQYGEDLVVDGILGNRSDGFFIDIGANDPTVINNTKRFYERGWSGINIEPNPTLFKKLIMQRSRDLNLNVGLGNSNQYIPFYLLSADTLSSFNKEDAERNCKQYNERIVDIINIQMCTLKDILDKFSGSLKKIDFLSVDVEGFELDVLKGNDWNKYRPTLILIEININGERIISFLKENGYEIVFKNSTNGIFIDGRNLQRKI